VVERPRHVMRSRPALSLLNQNNLQVRSLPTMWASDRSDRLQRTSLPWAARPVGAQVLVASVDCSHQLCRRLSLNQAAAAACDSPNTGTTALRWVLMHEHLETMCRCLAVLCADRCRRTYMVTRLHQKAASMSTSQACVQAPAALRRDSRGRGRRSSVGKLRSR
jgi:hypothetical protein